MSQAEDTRDRLIVLEQKVEHLTVTLDKTAATVERMDALLQQAKGARWAIMFAASIGGFVSAKIAIWAPWILSGGR